MSKPTDAAHEWHRIIRASVRECLETWVLQTQAGAVTVEALCWRGRRSLGWSSKIRQLASSNCLATGRENS
jgi:hypothetical protein